MGFINSIKVFKRYLYLLGQLVSRDFKVKYKRSVLGVLWSVLNPLLTMFILNIVFSSMMGMGKNDSKAIPDFPVYLLIGITVFNYFIEATNLSLGAVVGNFNLITKVYMPKYIFTLSKVLSSAVNLLFSLIALYLIVFIEIFRGSIGFYWTNIILPYDLLFLVIFAIGMGLFLSALTVFFRDMYYIWGVVTTAWMYLTPIIYPITLITNSKLWYKGYFMDVMQANPMYYFVTFARKCVLNGTVPLPSDFLGVTISALAMLVIGLLFFRSRQDKFIYYV